MTPEQITEAGQRLAKMDYWTVHGHFCPAPDAPCTCGLDEALAALEVIQAALREWVPREDREQAFHLALGAGVQDMLIAIGDRDADAKRAEVKEALLLARRLLKLEDTPDV